jgi:hypothetical protein
VDLDPHESLDGKFFLLFRNFQFKKYSRTTIIKSTFFLSFYCSLIHIRDPNSKFVSTKIHGIRIKSLSGKDLEPCFEYLKTLSDKKHNIFSIIMIQSPQEKCIIICDKQAIRYHIACVTLRTAIPIFHLNT